jgi:hypothetical protein
MADGGDGEIVFKPVSWAVASGSARFIAPVGQRIG